MASRRQRTLVGVAMVVVGVVQAALFAVESEWVQAVLGAFFAVLGVAYLWFEVYAVE